MFAVYNYRDTSRQSGALTLDQSQTICNRWHQAQAYAWGDCIHVWHISTSIEASHDAVVVDYDLQNSILDAVEHCLRQKLSRL